jgi:hypothetical protein
VTKVKNQKISCLPNHDLALLQGRGGLFQNEGTKIYRERPRKKRAVEAGGAVSSVTLMSGLMAISGKPSARLTLDLKLITGQRLLRSSILKETPTPLLK